jgi:hypothetical protein
MYFLIERISSPINTGDPSASGQYDLNLCHSRFFRKGKTSEKQNCCILPKMFSLLLSPSAVKNRSATVVCALDIGTRWWQCHHFPGNVKDE